MVVLLAPASSSAQVWRPLSSTDALAPLDPIASGPIAFPAPGAPRIIVGVAPGADLDAVAASLRPYASSLQILRAVGEVALVASNAAAVADLAARDPRIEFAQPDRSFPGLAEPFDVVDPVTGLAYDWQYDAVQAGPAIAAVGGGSSTIVAVVDSGVDVAQPDLAGRLLPGYDATGSDGTVFDSVGHGTFVAGLIAMVDGNGIGAKGIAGATRVLPVRASVNGSFTDDATVRGITWAADNGAGVINLSLGGPGDDPALDRAIDYATAKGVLVVASAGNSGDDPGNPVAYPAAYVGGPTGSGGWSIGLSVGATTPANQPAYFSTHNSFVSVAAPGAGPSSADCAHGDFSTIPVSTNTTEWDDASNSCNNVFQPDLTPGAGRWAYGEGTSFSAPIVSAVAALVRQANPILTPAQVADVIRRSATQTFGTGWNEFTGAGIVNANAAVAVARTYDTTPPTAVFTAVPKVGGIQADLTATDSADPGKTVAGGVTLTLEESRDGTTWGTAVPAGPAPVSQLIATTSPVWLRSTVCDADHNCAQQVKGPLTALIPAPPKARPQVHLKLLSHTQTKLKVRVELGKGAKGSAVVELQSWTGKKWRPFDRVTVPFGKTRIRTEHVSKKGRYKLRAHLLGGPSFIAAFSGSLSLRVR